MKNLFCLFCLFCFFLISRTAFAADVESRTFAKQNEHEHFNIEIKYPVLGNAKIDADIDEWVQDLARGFEEGFTEDEEAEDSPPPFGTPYELKTDFEISRPSARALSIVWYVFTYTGGVHGVTDILVKSWDMRDGAQIDLHDLFRDLDTALQHMSAWCYRVLPETLGEMYNEDMVSSGASPDADNFSSIALTPNGVRIYFSPYQVASFAAGSQIIDMPLEEFADADPRYEFWDRNPVESSSSSFLNRSPTE